jgi:Arc/MetJ-type ribon-helix-helix transcriptional regulator
MEIRLPPDQEAHIAALAASSGRSIDELVREAVALWEEHEDARVLAEFRASLDRAEASLAEGKGRVITQESMHELAEDVKRRGRERRTAAEAQSASRS